MTDLSGTWDADLAQSKFVGPAPAAMRVKIEHRGEELREEIVVTKPDGSQSNAVFACRVTGESDTGLFNGQPVRSLAQWVADELVIETWMNVGSREMYFCDYWSLSSDGQSLVMEHRNDTLAGQRVVLERVS